MTWWRVALTVNTNAEPNGSKAEITFDVEAAKAALVARAVVHYAIDEGSDG